MRNAIDAIKKVNEKALKEANAENIDTLKIDKAIEKEAKWRCIFKYMRFLMPVSLLVTWIIWRLFIGDDRLVLWIEWVGIWAFSFYWLLKSIEILSTQVDLNAIEGRVKWNGINKN